MADATEEHDAAIEALFDEARVPIRPEFWERSYSPQAPSHFLSTPQVAVRDGRVEAFAAARPTQMYVDGEYLRAHVLHDVIATPGRESREESREAIAALLHHYLLHTDLLLSAGPGIALAWILQQERFQWAGNFHRLRYPARVAERAARQTKRFLAKKTQRLEDALPAQPYDMALTEALPEILEPQNQVLIREKRIFRQRTGPERNWLFRGPAAEDFLVYLAQEESPCDAYAVLRRDTGRSGEAELHAVDFYAPIESAARLAQSLKQIQTEQQATLYFSVLNDDWAGALEKEGFERLAPRWGVFWALGDSRAKSRGLALIERQNWLLTPADGEADR